MADRHQQIRKVTALEALFARVFRIAAGKEYLINVHWSARSSSHSRPLHPSLIQIVFGIACVLALGLGCLAFAVGDWAVTEVRAHLASSRHQAYLTGLDGVRASLSSLETALDSAYGQERKMRALYGINNLDAAHAAFGVGGRAHPTAEDANLSFGMYESLFQLELKTHQLRGRMELSLKSLRQIADFVAYRHDMWDHTPSIVPARGEWVSGFGYRIHPITGQYAMHEGLDIANGLWTPIYSTADGIVSACESGGNYGNLVVMDHGNGFHTKFGHLSRILVEKGQLVKRYALIGYMGSTGRATGTHVHYEVVRDGNPQDPGRFILPSGLLVD